MADGARFYSWSPDAAEGLTGSRLRWWINQAKRIARPPAKKEG